MSIFDGKNALKFSKVFIFIWYLVVLLLPKNCVVSFFFFGRGDGLRQYRRDGTGQVAIFGYEKKSMA